MSYDGNTGGIAGKSDAGTFTYDPFEKPYAIKSIDPTTGLVPDSTQTIGYTSFNKVGSISENGYEANFIYGSDDQRSRMIVKQNGNTILTRWYPTGSYVKETSGGVTKEYTFIGGDAYSAPAVAIKQNGSTSYYSILRDHLGSITHVVSSSGSVVAEYSYDAWGRMRNPSTWTNYEPGSEPALMIAGRGHTGHEHLPWFNTINMNGRLYDPLSGMFFSPDNYVQSAENSQNFNRYSYCINNPLKYLDPSGYLFSASGDRVRMESYLRRQGYSQVDIWMMESDPFMGSAFDFGESCGGGGGGGMGYGTTFYETFVRPTQQPNFTSIEKHDGQYGYWVREWVDSNGSIVYPTGKLSGGGNITEISICEKFIPITLPQSEGGEHSSEVFEALEAIAVGTRSFVHASEEFIANYANGRTFYTTIQGGTKYIEKSRLLGYCEVLGQYTFWAGATVNFIGVATESQSVAKGALNVGVEALPFVIGAGPGLVIGVFYFTVDKTVGWEKVMTPTPNHPGTFTDPYGNMEIR